MNLPVKVKGVDVENKTLEAIFSVEKEDRHGDVIVQEGWDIKNFKKNPVILNSHNYNDAAEVIGKASNLKIENKKLTGRITFAVDQNPKAKVIFDLYAGGFLNAFSVGFIPKAFAEDKDGKTDWFKIAEAELLEVSAVSVPANAYALAKEKGIDGIELVEKDVEEETTEEDEEEETVGTDVCPDCDNEECTCKDDNDDEEEQETPQEKKIRLTKELEDVTKELGEDEDTDEEESGDDDEEGDDSMIQHTGKSIKKKSINAKVLGAVKSIEKRETRKLKRVHSIVEKMLDDDASGAKMSRKVLEKVRKRRVNQAIRELYGLR